jgi:hypothetical protein
MTLNDLNGLLGEALAPVSALAGPPDGLRAASADPRLRVPAGP